MAKKVKITSHDFKLENIEKNVQNNNQPKETIETKIVYKKQNNTLILIVAIISVLGNGILGYLAYDYYQKSVELDDVKSELKSTENELEDVHSSLFDITGLNSVYYTKNKLDFMDENIVFKIEGFGNYYYTYDCMMEKVNGSYTYWAYNKEAAISQGIRKGSC